MKVLRKEKRCVFQLDTSEKIVIPSRMYPLETDGYQLIYSDNTEPINDNKIVEILNSVEAVQGCCFTNSGKLLKALHENGYPNAKQYVGWVFSDTASPPVHHSFVMIDNHILDLSIQILSRDKAEFDKIAIGQNLTKNELRSVMVAALKDKVKIPNNLKCNVGKCDNMYLYCAAEGTEEQGRSRNHILRKEYPQHPAFKDVKNSITKTQEMMIQEGLI